MKISIEVKNTGIKVIAILLFAFFGDFDGHQEINSYIDTVLRLSKI